MAHPTLDEAEIKSQIAAKVRDVLDIETELTEDENLLVHGLDSMKSMKVIVAMETLFDIEFDDEDLLLVNFIDINTIYDLIAKHLNT